MLQASHNAGFNIVSFSFIAMPHQHLWWVNRLIKKKEKIRVSWRWNLVGTVTNTMKLDETSVESRESFICDPVRRRRSWLHHPPPSARSALLPSIPSPFMRPLLSHIWDASKMLSSGLGGPMSRSWRQLSNASPASLRDLLITKY